MAVNCYWSAMPVGHLCARNLGHETSQTTSDTFHHLRVPSPYTLQIFIWAFQMCFHLSWNDRASCAKTVPYVHPSAGWKWPQHHSVVLMSVFLKHMLLWHLSWYTPTKQFPVKLKTRTQSRVTWRGRMAEGWWGPYWLLGQPGIKTASTRIEPLKSITVCVLLSQH